MQPQMNVNPDDFEDVVCECGSILWIEAHRAKLVPSIMSPTGQTTVAPIPQLICMNCGSYIEKCVTEEEEEKSPIIT